MAEMLGEKVRIFQNSGDILIQIYSKLMRTISQKQAEKWLDKLKNKNPQAYQEVTKALKKYDRNQNQHECYLSLNRSLFKQGQITQQLNTYLEGDNKFTVDVPYDKKFDNLMKNIKANNRQGYQKIIHIIQTLTENQEIQNVNRKQEECQSILHRILERLSEEEKGLKDYIQKELQAETADTIINKKNLDYLKGCKVHKSLVVEEPKKKSKTNDDYIVSKRILAEEKFIPKIKPYYFNNFTNISEEKSFLKKLQKTYSFLFPSLIKLINLYTLSIISKNQIISLLVQFNFSSGEFEALHDILVARQVDRRKLTPFKPLNDMDFENVERATFSYVIRPITYPTVNSNWRKKQQKILNFRWVSVPLGSEQNFNIRIKNNFEMNMLKNEDEMYEFDSYLCKLRMGKKLIKKIIKKIENHQSTDLQEKTLINLGILQILLKNCNREQKQELQLYLKVLPLQTYQILDSRIGYQIDELQTLRQISGKKQWVEINEKNFYKALNIRSAEFKRIQREKLKPASLLAQLTDRYQMKIKQKRRGQWKFDKEYDCQILNTLESIARSQTFKDRKYPEIHPQVLRLKKQNQFSVLPEIIMSFQDETIFNMTINYIWNYINTVVNNQAEREKLSNFLFMILCKFFAHSPTFQLYRLKDTVNDEVINEFNQSSKREDYWDFLTLSYKEEEEKYDDELPLLKIREDQDQNDIFVPLKNDLSKILYSNENFYIWIRLVYSLYERMIKAKQYTENLCLFEMIITNSIRSKETNKLEEGLSQILNDAAYLFSTLNKILQQIVKQLQLISNCQVVNRSFQLMKLPSDHIYHFMFTKFYQIRKMGCLKVVRYLFSSESKLLYVKLINEIEDNIMNQHLSQYHQEQLQYYLTLHAGNEIDEEINAYELNRIEYYAEEKTGKLVNREGGSDILVSRKKHNNKQILNEEIQRAVKMMAMMNDY